MQIIGYLILLFEVAVGVRIILSFFPISGDGLGAQVSSVVFRITEPVLGPLRRVIPTVGMLDFSPMIVLIGCEVLRSALR